MRHLLPAALAALTLAAPACGHAQKPADDPTATVVSELVIDGRLPGPAWWRVSKGEAIVLVMGVPGLTPKDTRFDDSTLRRRLGDADRLILAQEPSVSVFSLMRFLAGVKRFPAPQPLSSMVSPAQAERLHAVLKAQGEKPGELDDMRPALAGFMLANGGGGGISIHMGGLNDQVRALAKAQPKPPRIVSTGKFDVLGQLMTLNGLPQAEQLDCFDDGLRTAEAGTGGAAAVFDAWKAGHVRDVIGADRGFEACLTRSPAGGRDVRRRMAASVDAIKDALDHAKVTVALVELRPLLAQGGVLDQLRREGFEVRPAGGG